MLLTFFTKYSSLAGAILLIAGCCIGAGMLGLPLATAVAGFLPTCLLFFASWGFMLATGLLLLEANSWFSTQINLLSLTENTLGKGAKLIIALLFTFLFYCLIVAYIGGGGQLLSEFIARFFHLSFSPVLSQLVLVLFLGMIVFLGTGYVDKANRLLMVGLIFSYGALIIFGAPEIHMERLKQHSWPHILQAFPAMIISFGYHNLIPSLRQYLDGNTAKVKQAIMIGSFLPLIFYLLWDGVILGLLPRTEAVVNAIDEGALVTTLLRENTSVSYIGDILHAFAFFAIITSFMTIALSFVDFLADGLKIKKNKMGSFTLISLVMLPPFLFSLLYPTIFLDALNYAGAFGAVILFGMVPVIIVWKGRYYNKQTEPYLLPGGKLGLSLVGAVAIFIFLLQLKNELGI